MFFNSLNINFDCGSKCMKVDIFCKIYKIRMVCSAQKNKIKFDQMNRDVKKRKQI